MLAHLLVSSLWLAAGAGPRPTAAGVAIHSVTVTRTGGSLAVEYRVRNGSRADVYVACMSSDCPPDAHPPYVAVKGRRLSLTRRLVLPPAGWSYAAPPVVEFRRIPAGETLDARLVLRTPVRTVSSDPRVRVQTEVDLSAVDQVRIELGVLPCPDDDTRQREWDDGFLHMSYGSVISCRGRRWTALSFQRLVSGNGSLGDVKEDPDRHGRP